MLMILYMIDILCQPDLESVRSGTITKMFFYRDFVTFACLVMENVTSPMRFNLRVSIN